MNKEFWDLVTQRVSEGYIKIQKHPDFDLWIYNYTDKAQFDNVWDEATMSCRGLIVNERGEIVARGMKKFFNHGQPGAAEIDLYDQVHVRDKLDGSLGIVYPTPLGEWAVATRGSFTSEQAVHATELLNREIDSVLAYLRNAWEVGNTVLVEIIYPENRIVLNYLDRDEIPQIGEVDNREGWFLPAGEYESLKWPWGVASGLPADTYADALALPPRRDAEGIVVTRSYDGAMVKIKQEDYLEMHRLIFGLSARRIWEMMVEEKDVDSYIETLPDEFQQWASDIHAGLLLEVEDQYEEARQDYCGVLEMLDREYGPAGWERGDFARKIADWHNRFWVFMLLDGRDPSKSILKHIKPAGNITPVRGRTEDVA